MAERDHDSRRDLWQRFPSLRRLLPGSRRIPYVMQNTGADCGAACLTAVLAFFGKHLGLGEVRAVTGTDRDGVNARSLIEAARFYGLRGRGVSITLDDLDYMPAGSILFWDFNHFVVFEKKLRRGALIMDPAFGRLAVSTEQLRRSFTGVALVFEPDESFESQAAPRSTIFRYARHLVAHSGFLWRIALLSILVQLFALALPVLTGLLVDRIVPRDERQMLVLASFALASLVVFYFLSVWVRSRFLLYLRTHMDSRMTLGLLEHIVDLPFGFFESRPPGDLMVRVNSNATVREILTSGALSTLFDGSLVIFYLAILFAASPTLGAVVILLGALQLAIYLLCRRRTRELVSKSIQTHTKSQSHLFQMLAGMETLKAGASEIESLATWSDLYVDELNASLERGHLDSLVEASLTTLRVCSPMIVLVCGGFLVLDGQLSLGSMLALSAMAAGFLMPLSNLISTAFKLQMLSGHTKRLDDVFDTPPEQDGTRRGGRLQLRGQISLDRVSFRYGPLSPRVVRDLSLTIEPGQFVVIVGRSAAGKSTLSKLLLGLYPPTSGQILFDGINLAELDFRQVRREIGIVTQNPYLFGGSILNNICLGEDRYSFEDIVQAAKLAEIHDDIARLPMGYDTQLSTGAVTLSGGQVQRIALARALVRQPRILLLDEVTSALDSLTESAIQGNLERLGCTRIVIAHRLSTIVNADLIVVMHEGRLVESGRHRELLKLEGHYARLIAGQQVGEGKPVPGDGS